MDFLLLSVLLFAGPSAPGGAGGGVANGPLEAPEAQFGRFQGLDQPYSFMHFVDQPSLPPQRVYLFALAMAVLLALGLYLLQRRINARWPALWKRCLVSIGLALMYFVLLELSLSVFVSFFPYQLFIPDPVGFWQANPQIALSTGRYPFHGWVYMRHAVLPDRYCTPEKPADAFRIICLGDSQTMGMPWVDTSESYPKVLQGLLNEKFPGRGIEVVNGGISGYTSFQGLFALKHIALGYDPDVLLISYCLHENDPSYAEDKEIMSDNASVIAWKRLLYRSQLYLMLRRIIYRQKAIFFDKSRRAVVARVSPEDYDKNLRELVKLARARQIRVYFLDLPVDPLRGKVCEPYRLVFRQTAQAEGISFIDARTAADALSVEQRRRFYFDGIHFTPMGNRRVAEVIARQLGPRLFVPKD